jgi:hypothetical protein
MKYPGIIASVLAFTAFGAAYAQDKSIKSQIVGSWDTVSVMQERADGTKVDLFNGRVSGQQIYTSDGHFSQMNFQTDRAKVAAGNRQNPTPEEAVNLYKQSYSLFGTYTVDEAAGTYTITITNSSFPNEIGNTQARKTTFKGDEMVFVNPAPASGGTGVVNTMKRLK